MTSQPSKPLQEHWPEFRSRFGQSRKRRRKQRLSARAQRAACKSAKQYALYILETTDWPEGMQGRPEQFVEEASQLPHLGLLRAKEIRAAIRASRRYALANRDYHPVPF